MLIEALRSWTDPVIGWNAEALDAAARLIGERDWPWPITPHQLQAVANSELVTVTLAARDRRLPRLESLGALDRAEHARLLLKGRALLEHCLDVESFVCINGFIDHELEKTSDARAVVWDLLDDMGRHRAGLESRPAARTHRALTETMMEIAVSRLHGLDETAALELAETRRPT